VKARGLLAAAALCAACAAHKPGAVEARGTYYADSEGLTVVTTGAIVEQRIAPRTSIQLLALADRIVIDKQPSVALRGGGQASGHRDTVDAVTSASIVVSGGDHQEKWRGEAQGGVIHDTDLGAAPLRLEVLARGSLERDYRSIAGRARATVELFERNLALSVFAGAGHDLVVPTQAPPGEAGLWPASHGRLNMGLTGTQLLGRSLSLNFGAAFNHQAGQLANPYRRALVLTTLFPEELPRTRDRVTGFVGVSWAVAQQLALHASAGGYADSWGVRAFIPEAALVKELGSDKLVSLRYRYYRQRAARFYSPRYDQLLDVRSGDARLGQVEEHYPSVELRWTLLGRPGGTPSLTALGGYGLSLMNYRLIGLQTSAVVLDAALLGSW
jgi:hypothetical protein